MDIAICGVADVPELASLFVEMEDYYFGRGVVSYEDMSAYLAEKVFSAYSGVTVAWIVYRVECSVIAMFDDLRIFIKSHPAFLVVPKG